jgi:hypothetical protein
MQTDFKPYWIVHRPAHDPAYWRPLATAVVGADGSAQCAALSGSLAATFVSAFSAALDTTIQQSHFSA